MSTSSDRRNNKRKRTEDGCWDAPITEQKEESSQNLIERIRSTLPSDVQMTVISFWSNRDIRSILCVNRSTNDSWGLGWEILALRRFGTRIVSATHHLYDKDNNDDRTTASQNAYKAMVVDDNRLGACPTLYGQWKSSSKFNRIHKSWFGACLVLGIQWHRSKEQLWVFIEARGRSPSLVWSKEKYDSMHHQQHQQLDPVMPGRPDESSFQLYDLYNEQRRRSGPILPMAFYPFPNHDDSIASHALEVPTDTALLDNIDTTARRCQAAAAAASSSSSSTTTPASDRYKGVLVFHASHFTEIGVYKFSYHGSNNHTAAVVVVGGYEECILFALTRQNGLIDVFEEDDDNDDDDEMEVAHSFTLQHETPFDSDHKHPLSWIDRWGPHLPGGELHEQGPVTEQRS